MDHLAHRPSTQDKSSARRRPSGLFVVGTASIVLVMGALVWFLVLNRGSDGPSPPVLKTVAEEPISGSAITTRWSAPSAIALDGEWVHVLDTGNNRILTMDREGVVDQIICETGECTFLLEAPQDMEVHNGLFYVANTDRGQVDVIDNTGAVVRTYQLPAGEAEPPRATGVYVAEDGSVFVSDWVSGKVAIFEPGGTFRQYFGADTIGEFEFAGPTGLTVDQEGNLYVAEFDAGRVQKISPAGRHLATFWMVPGSTQVSQITDVVISESGLLFASDNKRSLVHVFSASARYLGIIGLFDATRIDSPGALLRPYGLAVSGDQIFVIDQQRGYQVYSIDPEYFLLNASG